MSSLRIAHQGSSVHKDPSIRKNHVLGVTVPVSEGQTCNALQHDGKKCYTPVVQPDHKLCPRHWNELKKMNQAYKDEELKSESLDKVGRNEQEIRSLITIKKEIIRLRGQVQLRFFSRAADNLGHSQRFLILQADIKRLVAEEQLVQRSNGLERSTGEIKYLYCSSGGFFPRSQITANAGIDPSGHSLQESTAGHAPRKDSSSSTEYVPEDKNVKLVYRSLLSQQVPVDRLNHLEADHPAHVIKKFLMDMANGLVDKLLEMEDVINTIVRNWFRRIVLARGQPGVLDLASRHTTIMGFLRSGVEVEELRKYVEYFENIDIDALRHLRRSASDSFSNQNRPTITLLGGSVSTDDGLEQLSTEQWDIVFGGFNNVIPWYLVPSFSISFERISTLASFCR